MRFKRVRVGQDGFYPTGVAADSLHEGQILGMKLAGQRVAIARSDGRIVAFQEHCPHGATLLSGGWLRRGQICCPEHNYCFDLLQGHTIWPPDEHYVLRRYEVQIIEGQITVHL
jgi:nitrite reductase/ring-hydroxylating ferredoxin subunit